MLKLFDKLKNAILPPKQEAAPIEPEVKKVKPITQPKAKLSLDHFISSTHDDVYNAVIKTGQQLHSAIAGQAKPTATKANKPNSLGQISKE